jgi:hypothetical protein
MVAYEGLKELAVSEVEWRSVCPRRSTFGYIKAQFVGHLSNNRAHLRLCAVESGLMRIYKVNFRNVLGISGRTG